MRDDWKSNVKEIIGAVGPREAKRLIAAEGVSVHTTAKIVGGSYQCEVGLLIGAAIKRVLLSVRQEAS